MDPRPIPPAPAAARKSGFRSGLRYLLAGPFNAFGTEQIVRNAAMIESLVERIKAGRPADNWVPLHDDHRCDLVVMALRAGVRVEAITARLANRRRETARAAWCCLAGAVGSLAMWFVEAIATPSYARLTYVAGLLLVCAAFALSAFYNALVNWQVRTRRLGTAREFLSTNESWWPSW